MKAHVGCDASALVALLLDGGSDGQWVTKSISGADLVAPSLVEFEAANIVRRHELAGLISADQAAQSHADLLDLAIELWPYELLAQRAWDLRQSLSNLRRCPRGPRRVDRREPRHAGPPDQRRARRALHRRDSVTMSSPARRLAPRVKMSPVLRLATILFAACLVSAPAAGAATRPLALGFYDPVYVAEPPVSSPWLQRTVDAGADLVKLDAGWPAAARPLNARNPADPAYDFSRTDRAVKAARAHGLRVLLSFSGAPPWAEGPGRRASAPAGTWRPDPAAVGDYGAALARRYSGSFPDPAAPASPLPRVQALQVWNEPNLSLYLTPQWSGSRPSSPAHYRRMLRAFYAGVKSVAPRTLVVTAGTAPFGDPQPRGERLAPARFWRDLLCQTRRLRPARCPNPARFDVLAHHPYPGGPPRWKEFYADDVSIRSMAKLPRILRAAERSGRALPRGKRRPVWVTEVSYDSSPPDPRGVPIARHAHYVQQTLYELWRQGVSTIAWFRIVDSPPVPSYGDSNQSGIYRLSARAKPARRAFRFPFVVARTAGGGHRAWGRSPVAGRVTIERRRGARWIAVRRVTVRRHGTFLVRVSARDARGSLRARIGRETSLVS